MVAWDGASGHAAPAQARDINAQERGLLQGLRKGPRGEQGVSIPWVEISAQLRRGARIRHDNMVKNHWNGRLSTSYLKGSLTTAFVRRQKVLVPLRDLTALLQASSCSQASPWLGSSPRLEYAASYLPCESG